MNDDIHTKLYSLRDSVDDVRSNLEQARAILAGVTRLLPTKQHLEALDEYYSCRLMKVANQLEQLKQSILKER